MTSSTLETPRDRMLGDEKIGKLLLKLSVPSAVGMLVHALYNFIDMIFIGRWVGVDAIGGLIIAFPFQMLIVALAGMIGIGAASVVSRSLGAGNRQRAYQTAAISFLMAIGLGVFASIIGLSFLDSWLRLFGATDVLIDYSKDYLSILLYGAIFTSFGLVSNNIVRSEGRAVVAMSTMLVGTLLNLALDPIFIYVLEMGIRGAAIATIISQALSSLFLLLFFLYGKSSLRIHWSHFRFEAGITWEVCSIGFSSFVRQAGGSVMLVVVNNMLGKYGGDIYISCFGIINRYFMLLLMTIFGIVQGLQPIVGYNYGAKKFDRVNEVTGVAIRVASLICIIAFSILMVFPAQMMAIFSDDPRLTEIGVISLRLIIPALPLVGFQIVAASFFQAIGKARPALILGMSRQLFFLIPFTLLLPLVFGVNGVFMAFPAADFLAVLLTAYWFRKEVRLISERGMEKSVEAGG